MPKKEVTFQLNDSERRNLDKVIEIYAKEISDVNAINRYGKQKSLEYLKMLKMLYKGFSVDEVCYTYGLNRGRVIGHIRAAKQRVRLYSLEYNL